MKIETAHDLIILSSKLAQCNIDWPENAVIEVEDHTEIVEEAVVHYGVPIDKVKEFEYNCDGSRKFKIRII